MTNKEKINYLVTPPPPNVSLIGYYYDLLEKVGKIVFNYRDFMTTSPINCDEELKRLPDADYELCCALLTMLFREDHFVQYGCFDGRYINGDVQKIINRMVFLLEHPKI